ncbi:MAG: helix-turn-helix domain-containing protein [Cyanobacteria bacterium]|jgi:putative transcriptional regulator|nr:helix-turn-helix domain-containing protein [Cyanobacteria bacterium GSL.Bin21]
MPVILRLKELRDLNGMTQEQLAKKLGISRQSITNLEKKGETGELSSIRFSTIEGLCRELKVTPGMLFDYIPEQK